VPWGARSVRDGPTRGGETIDRSVIEAWVEGAERHLELAEDEAAHDLATRAEVCLRDEGAREDRILYARALAALARAHSLRDEYVAGIECSLRGIELWQRLGDRAAEAKLRAILARMLLNTGDTDGALAEALRALETAEGDGDLRARMAAMTVVGVVYLSLEQHDQSIAFCERAAETARMLGDHIAQGALIDTIACSYQGMAYAARGDGDEPAAVAYAEVASEKSREAMLIARAAGHRRYESTALANLAEMLTFRGLAEDGLALLESWKVDPTTDSAYNLTHHLDARGSCCMTLGRYDQAAEFFAQGLQYAEGPNAAMLLSEHLSEAYEASGDLANALKYHKHFHSLFKQVSSEAAQRSASIAVVKLETVEAKARAEHERARAEQLHYSNLELSRRAQDLLQQSLEDPLTGLANRRALDRLMNEHYSEYAVALIDVDHFKRVNDVFSHQIGDEVLRRLATLLRVVCRDDDLPARYGGEEFAVLLHNVDLEAATVAADRIRRLVQAYDWAKVAPGLSVTASVGVATGSEAASPVAVLALADQRLYTAKHAGRNRVAGAAPYVY
jgi:diguanylate cyclase (GGDEF)-like protein